MFDATSRYAKVPKATLTLPDGTVVAYARRRFLPQGGRMIILSEVPPRPGERLDALTHRTLGDPLAYWRVCDANDAMYPADLALDPRRPLRIPFPEAV